MDDVELGRDLAINRRTLLRNASLLSAVAALPIVSSGCVAIPASDSGGVRPSPSRVMVDEQSRRSLGGMGYGYQSTWAANDAQYMVVNDGAGWMEPAKYFHNARLWKVDGDVTNAQFGDVSGFPDLSYATRPRDEPRYFGVGLLAVRGRLYQFLNSLDRADDRPRHWTGVKLIYSDDNGRTWHNQNGSTPVVWESWHQQSRDSFTFYDEPDGCFAMLSILQMGKDYAANKDGYIYVYGPNGNVDGRMNELVMYRVPIESMLDRGAYQYYAGMSANGQAQWSGTIAERSPVHSFPKGWINYTNLFPGDLVVESWLPSVVYNEPLGIYMMANAGIGVAPDGTEFGKASYFGLWVADQPWGPWRQIHEDTQWTPGGDPATRAYVPRILPKWIAPDGKSFWLAYSDIKGIREFGDNEGAMIAALEQAKTPEEQNAIELDFLKRFMPGMRLNVQRMMVS